MLPELRDRLAAMSPESAAAELLREDPKRSGKVVSELLVEAGHTGVTPAEGKRLRRAVTTAARAPISETLEGDGIVAGIRHLLDDAVRVGDTPAIGQLTRALASLDGVVAPANPDHEDWSALTDVEASALAFLTAKARGLYLDHEAQWWQALFARIPEAGEIPHPAHVPLPAGAPLPPRLVISR